MMEINGYVMVNEAKVRRVIEGTDSSSTHRLVGGLGKGAKPELLLAHYDKTGGLITKNGNKVKTGAFWDFKANAPRETPEIVFEYRSDEGDYFEFVNEEPVAVKADKAKKAKRTKKTKDE